MSERPIVAFSDGASKGNPGPGGWGVVIVTPEGLVIERGGYAAHTTNNKMELTGAIEALDEIREIPGPVAVYTDSTYVIKGISEWIWGWRRRGWKTAEGNDVSNRDLWEQLAGLVDARGKGAIAWHYVRGHVGTPGNERVDEIADTLARQGDVEFYRGSFDDYPLAVLDLPADTDGTETIEYSGDTRQDGRSLLVSQPRRWRVDASFDMGRLRAPRQGPVRGAVQESKRRCGRNRHHEGVAG